MRKCALCGTAATATATSCAVCGSVLPRTATVSAAVEEQRHRADLLRQAVSIPFFILALIFGGLATLGPFVAIALAAGGLSAGQAFTTWLVATIGLVVGMVVTGGLGLLIRGPDL